jgi:integrase
VLTDEEIKSIWRLCNDPGKNELAGVSKIMALALQFAMVTLQRGNEVCGAARSEFDLANRIWTIPGERTKNHRSHVVPLSDLAVSIVKEALALKSDPENGFEANRNDSPVFGFLRNGRAITRHAFTRAMKRLTKQLKIKDAKPHDFRRTGSTNMTSERLGIPRFHVSCVLNHISDAGGAAAVTAVYDRNAYVQEKRRALDKWAVRLMEIVNETIPGENIVNLRRSIARE